MTTNQSLPAGAIQLALGYAWGREDASGTVTAAPATGPSRIPSSAFAEAFATGQDEYNQERRCMMTNVRSAYERWQASGGRTIWDEYARPAKPVTADDLITRVTEAATRKDAQAILAGVSRATLLAVADQLYIEPCGHGLPCLRASIVAEARS